MRLSLGLIVYLSLSSFFLVSAPIISHASGVPYDIVLKAGNFKHLAISPEASVHIQNGSIIKAKDDGRRLKVTGKKQGLSDLRVGNKLYKILVLTQENYNIFESLNNLCQQFLGPYPVYYRGKVYLSGHIYRFSDWKKIADVFKTFQRSYLVNAKVDDDALKDFQAHVQNSLKNSHLPLGKWGYSPFIELLYAKADKSHETQLNRLLKPFGIHVRFVESAVGLKPMVRVKIIVAEVSKQGMSLLGVNWPTEFSAQVSGEVSANPIEVSLSLLEAKGLSKTLASPTLLTKSGSKAEFFAGGEVPIKASGFKLTTVSWKSYGIRLNIKPKADLTGNMSIAISSEVSSLDFSHAEVGIPSIKSHHVSSHVDLKNTQTIILSGLLKQDEHVGESGLKLLQSVPLLGELFKSANYLNKTTELIVFITPSIVEDHEKFILPKKNMPSAWEESL